VWQPSNPPHQEKRGNVTQLIVDGRPFLALAGELYNSSATGLEYMKPVWPRLSAMHLNTVLAARNYAWAELLKRVFWIDGLECPRCGGRMRILAAIQLPEAIRKILECLGLPPYSWLARFWASTTFSRDIYRSARAAPIRVYRSTRVRIGTG
jgi:hypothetical protein